MLFLFTSTAEAKVLPRFKSNKAVKSAPARSNGVTVSARLSPNRTSLDVFFNNLNNANSVSYTLSYQADGVEQGVIGTLDSSSGNSTTRNLLFGTCSKGVCRYHQNITNMKLEISSELKNGKTSLRRFTKKRV